MWFLGYVLLLEEIVKRETCEKYNRFKGWFGIIREEINVFSHYLFGWRET
jgi:hypothetical protein